MTESAHWTSPCFEIDGFGFQVLVDTERQRATVLSDIASFPPHHGSPDVRVRWHSDHLDLGAIDFIGDEGRRQYAHHPDGLVARHNGVTGIANAERFELGGAPESPDSSLDDYQTVFSALLTHWLSHRAHFPIHGGAIGRGGKALLFLGHPGAGKSTAAWAAHRSGFDLIADDVLFAHTADDGPRVAGLPRPVAIPGELLDHIPQGASQAMFSAEGGGRRNRWGLAPDILTLGSHRLIGIVLAAHGDNPDGEFIEADRSAVLPLVVAKYYAADDEAQLRAWFPHAAAIARLPAWELRHTPEVDRRLEVAAGWISVAFDRALAAEAGG